tara:strand:+ start:42433 stop:42768 length:336 start_codon:yes stop_codon:yes gene_type:complete
MFSSIYKEGSLSPLCKPKSYKLTAQQIPRDRKTFKIFRIKVQYRNFSMHVSTSSDSFAAAKRNAVYRFVSENLAKFDNRDFQILGPRHKAIAVSNAIKEVIRCGRVSIVGE